MASFDRMYSSSPVLAMPPQAVHQGPFNRHFLPHQASSFSRAPHLLRNTASVAGRKRSRDEAAVNLDSPEKIVELPKEPEDEWVYGPGMTLIKKSTGYVADAGSQSGTWLEEKMAKEEARKADEALLAQQQLSQSRPSLRSNKSQRIVATGTSTPADRSSPTRDITLSTKASSDSLAQPVVDDFTMHLGIGWSRISGDEHIQAAARGWARYIENHYPVNNVKIRLESRGLQSYLVEADEGYFLFAENLRQGRLVSKDAERAMNNLKASPVTFDGANTMEATETPKPLETIPEFNTTPAPITTTPSVDIDMS